jgi:hypothetical protein
MKDIFWNSRGLSTYIFLWTFFAWRIQSLQTRTHGMWLYARPTEPTHESTNALAESEVEAWVKHVMEQSALIDLGGHPAPLC